MRHSRTRRSGALLVLGAAAALVIAASASAGLILNEPFHDEGTFVDNQFCDVPGMIVNGSFVVDGRDHAVSHGKSGLAYFIEHVRFTTILTNPATGKSVTDTGNVLTKDQNVTDNGDGTLTILVKGTGNEVVYGPNGKAIARNPGQVRYEILIDDGGTPADPFDDEFIADLGIVKESTGRSDDFCAAVVPALS